MERRAMLSTLKTVEPALSSKDLIPVFACFCFDGKAVTAYDDVVAMQTPLKTSFAGAAKGKVILDFLAASRAKEVEFLPPDSDVDEIIVKAGKSKLTLPLIPEEDFVFSFPEEEGTEMIVQEGLIGTMEQCLVSMGTDPSQPWMLGVTLHITDKAVTMYSSNTVIATKSQMVSGQKLGEHTIVMPPRFCALLCALSKKTEPEKMLVHEDWIEFRFVSGLRVFTRTIDDENIESYEAIFSQSLEAAGDSFADIPRGFERVLDRALVVLSHSRDKDTAFELTGERMRLVTETQLGLVKDSMKIAHPEVSVTSPPDMMKKVIDGCEALAFTPSVVLFRGPGLTRLVVVKSGDE